jgi:hypothetical protein
MRNALLTAWHGAHVDGTAVLLRSVRRWHPDVKRYCFVPSSDLAAARQRLDGLAEVLPPPRKIRGVPERYEATVSRLFAVTLPEDAVVYLDPDTLMCRPAQEPCAAIFNSGQSATAHV